MKYSLNSSFGEHYANIIHTFTFDMGKYITGILIGLVLVLNLPGIKMDMVQASMPRMSAQNEYAGSCFSLTDNDCRLTSPGGQSILDIFNSTIGDPLFSASSLPNGVNIPKNLKYASLLAEHASIKILGLTDDPCNLSYHFDFVKSPRRYFVCTLRRLLI